MKRYNSFLISLLLTIGVGLSAFADAPIGYYRSLNGLKGQALKNAVHNLIKPHTVVSYSSLWNYFPSTDCQATDKSRVWDMYSNKTYYFNGYRGVSGMHKEHSFPKSWWGGTEVDAYTDLHHLYPSDGEANMAKSNHPLGEVANASFNNGVTKVGTPVAGQGGGDGTVFEPGDVYKGDFARTYFYMATRYNTQIGSWVNNGTAGTILDGTSYPVYQSWYLNLMLKWHRQDPVSDKEIKRNDAAYDLQHNRNPFIDHPELVEYIWGDKQDAEWYEGLTGDEPRITLPVNGSTVDFGTNYTGSTASQTIEVKARSITDNITVTLSGAGFTTSTTTITAAQAMEGTSIVVTYCSPSHAEAQGTLTLTAGALKSVVNLKARAIDMMEANEATNVTATSFKASWVPVQDVQSYTLYVSGKGITPPPSGDAKLLLDEDMSEGTTKWRTAGATYDESTALRLGSGKATGSVTSPAIDLSASAGVTTVMAKAASYGTDASVEMKISVLNAEGNTLETKTVTLKKDAATYTVVLQGAAEGVNKVKIENLATKKRVLLTNVKVYAGDASNAQSAPRKVAVETGDSVQREITGITDAFYTVKNLAKNGTFKYQVKAVYTDGTESDYSDAVEVVLKDAEHKLGDLNADGAIDVSDVTALINKILGTVDLPLERCDLNGDGEVNVTDVTTLINMILG